MHTHQKKPPPPKIIMHNVRTDERPRSSYLKREGKGVKGGRVQHWGPTPDSSYFVGGACKKGKGQNPKRNGKKQFIRCFKTRLQRKSPTLWGREGKG